MLTIYSKNQFSYSIDIIPPEEYSLLLEFIKDKPSEKLATF